MDWGEIFGPSALVVLLSSSVAFAMPTALAAVGETVAERAGVLNLGLEGMMLSGALTAFLAAYYLDSVVLGVLAVAPSSDDGTTGQVLGLAHNKLWARTGEPKNRPGGTKRSARRRSDEPEPSERRR